MLILKLLRERVSEKNKIESSFYVYIAVGRGAFYDYSIYDFNGELVLDGIYYIYSSTDTHLAERITFYDGDKNYELTKDGQVNEISSDEIYD